MCGVIDNKMQKTILVDIDDTVVDLLGEWLRRYNLDYDDCVVKANITKWDMIPFVKESCGEKIYGYLRHPDLYECVELIDGAAEGIRELKELGFRVVFASSGLHSGKEDLLFRHKLIDHRKDLVIAYDKSLIKGDILVDDGWHNIESFESGIGILFDAHHNRQHSYGLRAHSWKDVTRFVNTVNGVEQLLTGRYR